MQGKIINSSWLKPDRTRVSVYSWTPFGRKASRSESGPPLSFPAPAGSSECNRPRFCPSAGHTFATATDYFWLAPSGELVDDLTSQMQANSIVYQTITANSFKFDCIFRLNFETKWRHFLHLGTSGSQVTCLTCWYSSILPWTCRLKSALSAINGSVLSFLTENDGQVFGRFVRGWREAKQWNNCGNITGCTRVLYFLFE